ncbi:hypothetical protein C0992_011953, partial [Termitomyces sp. T32_za158]
SEHLGKGFLERLERQEAGEGALLALRLRDNALLTPEDSIERSDQAFRSDDKEGEEMNVDERHQHPWELQEGVGVPEGAELGLKSKMEEEVGWRDKQMDMHVRWNEELFLGGAHALTP